MNIIYISLNIVMVRLFKNIKADQDQLFQSAIVGISNAFTYEPEQQVHQKPHRRH